MGRDPRPVPVDAFSHGFNPRARVGRDAQRSAHTTSRRCFNPRARVGRDFGSLQAQLLDHVSIHAPAWGATMRSGYAQLVDQVSIHAPAWGATKILASLNEQQEFQSTRPRGARPFMRSTAFESILFQSTRPRGARLTAAKKRSNPSGFNPRARVGRDWPRRLSGPHAFRFNPRARVGRDDRGGRNRQVGIVSIHAPAWGATVS